VQPDKVSVSTSSVRKACLHAAPEWQKWWRIPDGWWETVPSTCSCNGKCTVVQYGCWWQVMLMMLP